jgi:CRP-like cAMP-binding protein
MANRILESLPPEELALVAKELDNFDMNRDEILVDLGHRVEDVYFPDSGMISLVTSLGNRVTIETGTIGQEGMAGIEAFLGTRNASNRTIVQVPGQARKLRLSVFQDLAAELPGFRDSLRRYAAATLAIANQLAACNLIHSLRQRCARWLLTVHDNVEGNAFYLTHAYLAQMLGVRRAGVTNALADLTKRGLINSRRGTITILDRAGLEAAACECTVAIRGYLAR